jgi:tetratricopeptide (TPR) repeat protein
MYELLTYRLPFDGENHAAVLMSILQQEPRAIGDFVPDCSPELEAIIQRALRKDESLRYQSMETLLVDLEPIWTSLQKEAVQKLVGHGRDLMDSGKLEEASEVLRKSLAMDTANVTARALFEQVCGLLGSNAGVLEEFRRTTGGTPHAPVPAASAGNQMSGRGQGGTADATPPFDPHATRVLTPVPKPPTQRPGKGGGAPLPSESQPQGSTQNPGVRSNELEQRLAGRSGGVAAETIFAPAQEQRLRESPPPSPIASPASTRAKTAGPQPVKLSAQGLPVCLGPAPQSARTSRSRTLSLVLVGLPLLLLLAVVAYRKLSPRHGPAAERASAPIAAPAPVAPTSQPASPAPGVPAVAAPAETVAANSPSLEDQQRRLIELAHEAADSKYYRTAQSRLEEAAKLGGPLNPLINDLRREFSDEAHGAELRLAAQQEQSLWIRAMKDLDAGRYNDSEKSLREILTLPEAGRHWEDAARYVDEVIPERRQEEDTWARAQQAASNVTDPEHRINEVRVLDQVLAQGGDHQQAARQQRDLLMSQLIQENRRRNGAQTASVLEPGRQQFSQLEDAVDQAVKQGGANALEQLQEIRPRFKAIVDGGGLLMFDARDYLNIVIPRAQRGIEDRLARAEADTAANIKYREAVKRFDQAVATQNTKLLRSQVQGEFQKIASSGGPRAEEARQYVNTLIPAALKKASR